MPTTRSPATTVEAPVTGHHLKIKYMLSPYMCHGTNRVVVWTTTPRVEVDPSGGLGAHIGNFAKD